MFVSLFPFFECVIVGVCACVSKKRIKFIFQSKLFD